MDSSNWAKASEKAFTTTNWLLRFLPPSSIDQILLLHRNPPHELSSAEELNGHKLQKNQPRFQGQDITLLKRLLVQKLRGKLLEPEFFHNLLRKKLKEFLGLVLTMEITK
jgi:hypothetical protein